MAKKSVITVKDVNIRTMTVNGIDYICITDIARQKNENEPKDVVKNWMRQKNTLEYLGLWERLHNPNFKGVEFDPLLTEAGSNAFTMSPTHSRYRHPYEKRNWRRHVCSTRYSLQVCQLGVCGV